MHLRCMVEEDLEPYHTATVAVPTVIPPARGGVFDDVEENLAHGSEHARNVDFEHSNYAGDLLARTTTRMTAASIYAPERFVLGLLSLSVLAKDT
jgi:hypothetical protein